MIRVVLDTNIIVSAYLNADGQPFRILKMAFAGAVKLCASPAILAEYKELLERKSFAMSTRRAELLFKKIRVVTTLVKASPHLRVATDPDDNIFLECAEAAKAQYLVTGNIRHFPKAWKYTKVVTPTTFLLLWQMQHGSPEE